MRLSRIPPDGTDQIHDVATEANLTDVKIQGELLKIWNISALLGPKNVYKLSRKIEFANGFMKSDVGGNLHG